jgi:Fic family protein
MIDEGIAAGFFKLRLSAIMELNRLAVDGLVDTPGAWRQTGMQIVGSSHEPPEPLKVPKHIEDMCDYVNDNWQKSPVHLAAYLMWRVNWIHPFSDGNGRTSRVVSYLVLCVRLRQRLPGITTIPDRIANNKKPYYDALEKADDGWNKERLDVSAMEELLSNLLLEQIRDAATAETDRESKRKSASITTHVRGSRRNISTQMWIAIIAGACAIVAAIIGAAATILSSKDGQSFFGLPRSSPSAALPLLDGSPGRPVAAP